MLTRRPPDLAGYKPYIDGNGFIYLITLVRKDVLRNRLEKHRLKVRYASCVTSWSETTFPISSEKPHRVTDQPTTPLYTDSSRSGSSQSSSSWNQVDNGWSRPSLPHCPTAMYYFPSPYPFSKYPVISYSHPRSLSQANPKLRVHIPSPYAQTLQLFEYTPESIDHAGDPGRAKQYACYTVFSTAGKRERAMHTLAPPGSNFDFAWAMFRGFFKRKVGVAWEDRDAVTVKSEGDRDIDGGCAMGEDGTDDDKFRALGLLRWKLPSDVAARQPKDVSTEGPCAVVVVNKPASEEHHICEKARAPKGGW